MADNLNQTISLPLSLFKPAAPPPKAPKIADQHVENFSEFNLGKKAPQPKIQKIRGQTFQD